MTRRRVLEAVALVPLLQARAPAATCRGLDGLLARRRMVRRFRPDPIGDDVVDRLIDAATRAPSAGHTQAWGFVVVRDAVRRRQLAEAAAGQTWLAEAPVAIVPCADPSRARWRYGERAARYAMIDTAFASMLLLLAVTEEGLGACFVGALDDARVRAILACPPDVQPLAVIPVGHPREAPGPKRRRPLRGVVHRERWGAGPGSPAG